MKLRSSSKSTISRVPPYSESKAEFILHKDLKKRHK